MKHMFYFLDDRINFAPPPTQHGTLVLGINANYKPWGQANAMPDVILRAM